MKKSEDKRKTVTNDVVDGSIRVMAKIPNISPDGNCMLLFHNNQKYYHNEFPCIFCNEYIYYLIYK